MKKLCLEVAVCVYLLVSTSTNATASTVAIDFDAATLGSLLTADYLEDGFTLTLISDHYDINSSGGTGNSQYIGLDAHFTTESKIRLTGSTGFNLVSLETIQWTPSFGEFLTVTSSAGGSVSFDTNAVNTFSGPSWNGLT